MDPIQEYVDASRQAPTLRIIAATVVGLPDVGHALVDIGDRAITAYLPASVATYIGASARVALGRNSAEVISSTPPGWTDVDLGGGWSNYLAGTQLAGYRRAGVTVTLKGLVKGGQLAQTLFTLPAGFRPPLSGVYLGVAGPGVARIDVGGDGQVVVRSYASSGTNASVSLAGISFTTI